MSVCETVTGPSSLVTNIITSTFSSEQLITAPPTTSTTSSPVVTSTCAPPVVAGNSTSPAVCTPITSYVPVRTVISGAVSTSTITSTTVIRSVVAEPGAVSTSCLSTTIPVETTTTTTTTTTDPTTTTTTTRRVRTTTTTTTLPTTTTTETTTSSPAAAPVVAPSTTAAPEVITSNGQPLTITSYSTLIITMTGANGEVSVLTTSSGVPTLNSATSGSGSSKSHTGAIAGGVVGGILALLLGVFVVILLRKKGCFRQDDEQFNDDIWAPEPHGQGVVGIKARSVHPDEDEDIGANSGDVTTMMSEKEAGDASVQDARQSWYGGLSSDHAHLSQRETSPTPYSTYDRAEELTQPASAAAAARVRRSVSGMSSSGHDSRESYHSMTNISTQFQPMPSVANSHSRRISQHEFHQHQQQRARSPTSPTSDYETYGSRGGMYDRAMDQRREELDRLHRRPSEGAASMVSRQSSIVSHHPSMSGPQSPTGSQRHHSTSASRKNSASGHSSSNHSTNAATTGSGSGASHGNLRPLTSLSPTQAPLYDKPYDFRRPQLEVVTNLPKLSSTSSGVLPSLVSSNDSSESSIDDRRSLTPPFALDPPRAAFLLADRPKFDRSSSTSSVIAPSQFLGARVVNADE